MMRSSEVRNDTSLVASPTLNQTTALNFFVKNTNKLFFNMQIITTLISAGVWKRNDRK